MPFDVTPVCADVQIIEDSGQREAVCYPKRKKVALVGFASNTLHLIPWTDPEFEIWGMNQGYLNFQRRADRWFEMHQPEATADIRDPGYIDFLKSVPVPVYMIQRYDEYPTSIRFPIEDAIRLAGRDYFMSSVSYMMALAIMEGFQEIHLYGINLAIGDEYFYEKPNAEWWIGKAEGMGIKVYVPQASSLLKQFRRYGYHVDARPSQSLKVLVNARINEYRAREASINADLHIVRGAMREDEALIQILEGIDHGADVVLMPQQPAPSTATT
jgi:hypothetical protein